MAKHAIDACFFHAMAILAHAHEAGSAYHHNARLGMHLAIGMAVDKIRSVHQPGFLIDSLRPAT